MRRLASCAFLVSLAACEPAGVEPLSRVEDGPSRGGRRQGPGRLSPRRLPRPDASPDEIQRNVRQHRRLEEEHERLEARSHELAGHLRDLRNQGAPEDERERVRIELHEVVNAQFDVRTRLRQMELERIERELHRLTGIFERMRDGFERRERERGIIIERRIDQLVGESFDGW